MLSKDEVKFLATLVQKGHLDKAGAERVFATASSAGDANLRDILVQLGLMAPERVEFLRRTGGEDVPVVPGYEYVSRAGFGGTSLVFEASEASSGRRVALKIMHRELHADAVQKRRFVHEAKLLMKLEHECIAKGYRVGHVKEQDGAERLIFVLEWVPGQSLLELLRSGRNFTEDSALFIILQAARALQYMHGEGVLHRDVKPDNILLTRDNDVKLIDLGFATLLEDPRESESDTTLGTAAYMSPEQARGTADLDVRSDIYSLGATLYQIAIGELPFSGEGTQEQLAARILEELSSPELQSRRISPHMNYFIRKMMEQERDFRYPDMGELIADIEGQIRGKKTMIFGGDEPDTDDGGGNGPPSEPKFPTRRRRR